MNEHDVIKFMGRFPDKIITSENRMMSKLWRCSKCNTEYRYEEEHKNPALCKECGSIFFEILRS